MAQQQQQQRRRRADGEESRRKILAAAAEIAGERGYEGTSMALVSARSGLPPSSIYWHFKDKDDLISAVIETSFGTWLNVISAGPGSEAGSGREAWTELVLDIANALLETPDFIRLGLMLALERRPEEPSARRMFLQVRSTATTRIEEYFRELLPRLDDASIRLLATYALSGADGLFIAREIGGDSVDLIALFRLHAEAIYDAAERLGSKR